MAMSVKTKIKLGFEPLTLHSKHPFGISYGTSSETKNVLVKLELDGHTGYGEAAPASYHGESRETVMAVLSRIEENAEEVFSGGPFAICDTSKKLDKLIAGHASAKAAIECAMHDLCGKIANLPTYKMLGLSPEGPMTTYTIGIAELDLIEKKTKEALSEGHKLLKIKLGTSYDRQIIEVVRNIAPDLPLRVDANGGWNPKQAIAMARFLEGHGVEFIEQPLPKFSHISDFKFVKDNSPLPIFADESAMNSFDVARLSQAVDGIVVKLAKCGGITEALRSISTARAHGLKIMFGMMLESSVGVNAALQLQSLCDYIDLDGALLLRDDPFDGAHYENGYLKLKDRPGLGVVLK